MSYSKLEMIDDMIKLFEYIFQFLTGFHAVKGVESVYEIDQNPLLSLLHA